MQLTFTPAEGDPVSVQADADGGFLLSLSTGHAGVLQASRDHVPGEDPPITTASALEALRMAVGLSPSWGPAGPKDFLAADFNGDGQVTTADALGILRTAVGLSAEEAPRWLFVESRTDLSEISRSNTQIDTGFRFDPATDTIAELQFTGILVGHVQEV